MHIAHSLNNPMPTEITQDFTEQLSHAAGTEPKPRNSPWLSRDDVTPFLF